MMLLPRDALAGTAAAPGGPGPLAVAVAAKGFAVPAGGRDLGNGEPVLGEVGFTVAAASFAALTGPSGVGKTTLLNLVAGLDADFRGRIDLPAGARLAYVFQEPRLLPWRTVRENVDLALRAAGLEGEGPWVDELLAAAGLSGAQGLHPTRISLGMARRAALVRAFALRPTLLLMDEPFVSLDEATAVRLRELLAGLLRRHPATVLFVTHDLREAAALADRVLSLAGRPARVAADLPVDLPPEARRDRVAVELAARELAARLAEAGAAPPNGQGI